MTDSTTSAPTFTLEAPPAVALVKPEQASQAITLAPEQTAALDSKAVAYVEEVTAFDPNDPKFSQAVESVAHWGAADIAKTAEVSNRMLQRPAAQDAAGSPQARVGKSLGDLRGTVTELDPNRADLTGARKLFKWLPGGNKIDNYFNKYRSAEDHLDAITRALASGQDELRKDNADIEAERGLMWQGMQNLRELDVNLTSMENAIIAKVEQLRAAGQVEKATALESDFLFVVRQRRQDIITQAAVNAQGYMALDLVKKNNNELIRGVDRARETTLNALRTAVIVSQALAQQKLVLGQINALNETTSNLILGTSEQLKTQGQEINQMAASTTIDIEKLQGAFNNVFEAMDGIDQFRVQANQNMLVSINNIQTQMDEAKSYLERSARGSGHLGANEELPPAPVANQVAQATPVNRQVTGGTTSQPKQSGVPAFPWDN